MALNCKSETERGSGYTPAQEKPAMPNDEGTSRGRAPHRLQVWRRAGELLQHRVNYRLSVQLESASTPEDLLLYIGPFDQAICELTDGIVIPPSLVREFSTQLRCHFKRPPTDELSLRYR